MKLVPGRVQHRLQLKTDVREYFAFACSGRTYSTSPPPSVALAVDHAAQCDRLASRRRHRNNFRPDLAVWSVSKDCQPRSAVTGGMVDVHGHPVLKPLKTRGFVQSDGDGTIARGGIAGNSIPSLNLI